MISGYTSNLHTLIAKIFVFSRILLIRVNIKNKSSN